MSNHRPGGFINPKRSIIALVTLMLVAFALIYFPATYLASSSPSSPTREPLKLPLRIDRKLLGQSFDLLSDPNTNTMAIATAARGPAGGLIGDFYHWKDPAGLLDSRRRQTGLVTEEKVTEDRSFIEAGERPEICPETDFSPPLGTLEYLRAGQNQGISLITVVNSRGLPNWFNWLPPFGANNQYVTTDLNELKELAADWVLYTNYTVQNFDQAHPPSLTSPNELERRSAEILNEIWWNYCNSTPPSLSEKLPTPGEHIPKLTYWEIGNEPDVPLGGITLSPGAYLARYGVLGNTQYPGIVNSMVEMDILINGHQTIKVGPALQSPGSVPGFQAYMTTLRDNGATENSVDFISYHPYNGIYGAWNHETITSPTTCYPNASPEVPVERYYTKRYNTTVQLPDDANAWSSSDKTFLRTQISGIHAQQDNWAGIAQDYLLKPEAELLATEWNPGNWYARFYLKWREKSMAHALASMETIFAFAHAGVDQAYYFPANGNTTSPTYQTLGFLKDHLGNQLDQIYPTDDPTILASSTYRGYVTHRTGTGEGEIILWGLNWGSSSTTINFQVGNLSPLYTYNLLGYSKLQASTLLHGAVNDPCAPSLAQPLAITFTPASASWTTQINQSVIIPPNSWVAYVIQRVPNGPIFTSWLPLSLKPVTGEQAETEKQAPYPAPNATPVITYPYPSP